MSLLNKRALHRWPEERHHLRLVIYVLNSVPGLDDEKRFQICERYVVSRTIIVGRKVLQGEGRKAFDLFVEKFIAQEAGLAAPMPQSLGDEQVFFLLRWLKACLRTFG